MSQQQQPGKTVVIAMDGSKYSHHAFQYYVDNAHAENDKIIIVHSIELYHVLNSPILFTAPYSTDKSAISKLIAEEEQKTKNKLEEFAKFLRDAKLKGTVKSVHATKPGEGIVQVAKDEHASYIVIGSRGLGTFRRTFLGSVSDYVVHHASVPVLVCRPEEEE